MGSFRRCRQLLPPVRRTGQAEILAQRHAFILRPEQATALQFRNCMRRFLTDILDGRDAFALWLAVVFGRLERKGT